MNRRSSHETLLAVTGAALIVVAMTLLAPGPAGASAVYTSSNRWASWTDGTYTVSNDGWGSHFDSQTLSVNSASSWSVNSLQTATSGVESYPDVSRTIDKPISSLSSVTSSFTVTDPGSGSYEAAYDIWTEDHANEIMVWTDVHHVSPIGSPTASFSLDGTTWTVWKGSNGSNNVYSFVDPQTVKSGSINVLSMLNWLENSQHWFSNETLGQVQFGWEVTTASPAEVFDLDNFSVSYSTGSGGGGGGSTGEVHATGAGKCLDVPDLSQTEGTQVAIWDCNAGANQDWAYTPAKTFTVYSGSKCLDASNNQVAPGTKVQIWPCNGGANQQWNVNSNGTITGVQSGLCLDVTGASTADGANGELWTCNGGSNQQWSH